MSDAPTGRKASHEARSGVPEMMSGNPRIPVTENPAFAAFEREYLQELERVPGLLEAWAHHERDQRWPAALGTYVVAVVVWFFAVDPPDLGFFALLALGPLPVLVLWVARTGLELRGRYQRACAATIVPFYGDLTAVSPSDLDLDDYRAWRIIPHRDGDLVTDQVRGSYQRVPFTVAGLYLSMLWPRRNPQATRYRYVPKPAFEGSIAVFQLAQPCRGTTVFRTPGMFEDHFRRLRETMDEVDAGSTELEILSSDRGEAAELLPPEKLDALERVRQSLAASAMAGSFHDRRLVLLVQHRSGSLYEPDHRSDLRALTEHVRCQLGQWFGVVETLRLEPVLDPGQTIAPPRINPRDHAFAFDSLFFGWGLFWKFLIYAALVAACGWVGQDRIPEGGRTLAAFAIALVLLGIIFALKRFILWLVRLGGGREALQRAIGRR